MRFEAFPGAPPYPLLPFERPECDNLAVAYSVSPASAIVDIGLFDSTGAFRGYSGGARSHFVIGRESATPGYLPGPLPSGTWHVLLGLYRIPPEGAVVTVEVGPGEPWVGEAVAPVPAVLREEGWLKGDLHTHSHHSDARGSLADLAFMARSRGLDFLAVTDHNTISHHEPWLAGEWGVIPLVGQEVTTFRGHFNVHGPVGWLDFRISDEARLREVLAEASARGGLRVLNHPKPCGTDWEFDHWEDFEALEVWNGPWLHRNWHALSRWHSLLCQGRRLPCVGGSDRHQPSLPDRDPPWLQLGTPTVRVLAAPSAAAILEAVRKGRCSLGESPGGPFLSLRSGGQEVSGGSLAVGEPLEILVEGEGRLRVLTEKAVLLDERVSRVELPFPDALFVRAEVYEPANPGLGGSWPYGITLEEVRAQERIRALSNPVYREG